MYIEVNELVLFIVLIIFINYIIIKKYKDEIKYLITTKAELINRIKSDKNTERLLYSRIKRKYRRIKFLRKQIWELRRKQKSTKISKKELMEFANNPQNNIEVKMCHENAKKFNQKFGGKIILGAACYLDLDKNTIQITSHLWNEYIYKDNGRISIQMIDILNFKVNEQEKYFNHRGIELEKDKYQDINHWHNIKEQIEKIINQKKEDTLLSYNKDTINDVYKL